MIAWGGGAGSRPWSSEAKLTSSKYSNRHKQSDERHEQVSHENIQLGIQIAALEEIAASTVGL